MSEFEIYEKFESYTRVSGHSLSDHCDEFDRQCRKVKINGTYLSEHILALKLLKSANLSDSRIIKASISDINYNIMRKQLK